MSSSTQNDQTIKRVLALDDDGTILRVLESALRMHGYESVTASQWVEALDAIDDREPDLLLLDLQMPHVDGIFLLEWIREQEMDIPVIVVSAYLDDESVARFKELGVTRLIWKPFNVADLLQEVEDAIGPPAEAVVKPEATEVPVEMPLPDSEEEEEEKPRRRHHRRRGSSRRRRRLERRQTIKYLSIVAVLCLLVSTVVYVASQMATTLSEIAGTSDSPRGSGDSIQDLIRAQIRAQIKEETGRRPALPKKPVELNLRIDDKK